MTMGRMSSIVVHSLAGIGILFWVGMVIATTLGKFDAHLMVVLLLAIVLGGAHALISMSTTRGSSAAIWLTVFVFVSDSLLGIFIDPKAFLLAGFTVVLFVAVMLTRRAAILLG